MGKAARQQRRLVRPRQIGDVVDRLAGYEQITCDEYGPTCWERLDRIAAGDSAPHAAKPPWCWVPMDEVARVVGTPGDARDHFVAVGGATLLWHLGAWRKGRSVYRFDPALADALAETCGDDRLPIEALQRLPEWGLYLILPEPVACPPEVRRTLGLERGAHVGGVLVGLDWRADEGHADLRVLLDVHDALHPSVPEYLLPQALHLRPGITVADAHHLALERTAHEATRAGVAVIDDYEKTEVTAWSVSVWSRVVPLVLYLGAANADLTRADRARPLARRAEDPTPGPAGPTMVDVGWRIGAELRRQRERASAAAQPGRGRSPAPHLRRAHWHHYWTGPRTSPADRTLDLRWVAPTLVGGGEGAVVVRPMRQPVQGVSWR